MLSSIPILKKKKIFIHTYRVLFDFNHAISTDIPDPLSPQLPIVPCFRQILRATSRIGTELLYVGLNWTS